MTVKSQHLSVRQTCVGNRWTKRRRTKVLSNPRETLPSEFGLACIDFPDYRRRRRIPLPSLHLQARQARTTEGLVVPRASPRLHTASDQLASLTIIASSGGILRMSAQ